MPPSHHTVMVTRGGAVSPGAGVQWAKVRTTVALTCS